MTIDEARHKIANRRVRSAWDRGVTQYALELFDELIENRSFKAKNDLTGSDELERVTEKELLNGASSWQEYSEGGCSLIYNCDIAKRLCSPSELKKVRGGERNPNKYENWIDLQAQALFLASGVVCEICNERKGY